MMLAQIQPALWMATPFAILLAAIALGPLLAAGWWSRHYAKVAFGTGAVTLVLCLSVLRAPAEVLRTAGDYVSFMCVVGSLFVVSGGIHINVKGGATPAANVVFLLVGAVLANILGTTGASMLLIRPWMRMNRDRLAAHHIVFFIFILSNAGGSLTPLGPPLFLGYLEGVPFWWVAETCWPVSACGVGMLLAFFYAVDFVNLKRVPAPFRERDTAREGWGVSGLFNLVFLAVVLGAVLVNRPPFLREGLMVAASLGSYYTTRRSVHESNQFDFHPLKEVAILFAGIFATMIPALGWLEVNAARFGQPWPGLFFWGSGTLSSVLDNAPTYLSFLSAEYGALTPPDTVASVVAYAKAHGANLGALAVSAPHADQIREAILSLQQWHPRELSAGVISPAQAQVALVLGNPFAANCLRAISMGSVFFGAATYIGNGPNFMVKAIAEQWKAQTPTFLGYLFKFTLPCLLPTLIVMWWVFFR
jgi:Na+/H+ antiporter NhaD/arsenite permease-like protein